MTLNRLIVTLMITGYINVISVEQKGLKQEWSINISESTTSSFYNWWSTAVGSGHANLALRTDWRSHMKLGHDKLGFDYVRFHGILDDDVGSVNDINDYSFINIDKIYQGLLDIGVKPYVDLLFMPDKFASMSNTTLYHYKGNISPPKSWNIWYEYIQQLTQHLVSEFGINEVKTWYFEVWNEPNCYCWDVASIDCCNVSLSCGNITSYIQLYNYTTTAIKSINPLLKVGGPATAKQAWIDTFLSIILDEKIPIDFVSTHTYPNQANSNIPITNINTWSIQLQSVMDVVEKYNNLYNYSLPLLISEFDSGLYRNQLLNQNKLSSVELNNHDNYYAANFMIFWANRLQPLFKQYINNAKQPLLQWLSFWCISDIFEENGFESAPFHDGFGTLTTRGIPKPVFRAFELLQNYSSNTTFKTIGVKNTTNGINNTIEMYTFRNKDVDQNRYSIFIANWNYLNGTAGGNNFSINPIDLMIEIENNIDKNNEILKLKMYRIDVNHTNPFEVWLDMGSPKYPSQQELIKLEKASTLNVIKLNYTKIDTNTVQFNLSMPCFGSVVIDLIYS